MHARLGWWGLHKKVRLRKNLVVADLYQSTARQHVLHSEPRVSLASSPHVLDIVGFQLSSPCFVTFRVRDMQMF